MHSRSDNRRPFVHIPVHSLRTKAHLVVHSANALHLISPTGELPDAKKNLRRGLTSGWRAARLGCRGEKPMERSEIIEKLRELTRYDLEPCDPYGYGGGFDLKRSPEGDLVYFDDVVDLFGEVE